MALQPLELFLCGGLYSVPTASIRIAAHLKQITVKNRDARIAPFLDEFTHLKRLPFAAGPILYATYENGQSLLLTQTLNILDFLEDSYPGRKRLIPSITDRTARSKVKDLAELIICGLEPVQGSSLLHRLDELGQDSIHWSRLHLARRMKVFEEIAEKTAGTYAVGNEISIADICLVTMVRAAYQYGLTFDRGSDRSDTKQFPTVERIVKECEKIDSFSDTGIPKQSLSRLCDGQYWYEKRHAKARKAAGPCEEA